MPVERSWVRMCHRPLGVVFSTPHWVYPGSGASHYRHSGKAWVTQTMSLRDDDCFIHLRSFSWQIYNVHISFFFVFSVDLFFSIVLEYKPSWRVMAYFADAFTSAQQTYARYNCYPFFVCLYLYFFFLSFCLCRGLHCGMLSQTCFLTNCVFSELGEYRPH